MDTTIIRYIVLGCFFMIIAFFSLVSLFTAYVLIRYGRTKSITVIMSLVFGALFTIVTLATFVTLNSIF